MKLTPAILRLTADAMEANANGQPVQIRNSLGTFGEWKDWKPGEEWHPQYNEYRPKPVPTVRAWSKPEDVPGPVCWLRRDNTAPQLFIHCVFLMGVAITDNGTTVGVYFEGANNISGYQYSTDRKTWLKCEVTEEPA